MNEKQQSARLAAESEYVQPRNTGIGVCGQHSNLNGWDATLINFEPTRAEMKLLGLDYLKRYYGERICEAYGWSGSHEWREIEFCSRRFGAIEAAFGPDPVPEFERAIKRGEKDLDHVYEVTSYEQRHVYYQYCVAENEDQQQSDAAWRREIEFWEVSNTRRPDCLVDHPSLWTGRVHRERPSLPEFEAVGCELTLPTREATCLYQKALELLRHLQGIFPSFAGLAYITEGDNFGSSISGLAIINNKVNAFELPRLHPLEKPAEKCVEYKENE